MPIGDSLLFQRPSQLPSGLGGILIAIGVFDPRSCLLLLRLRPKRNADVVNGSPVVRGEFHRALKINDSLFEAVFVQENKAAGEVAFSKLGIEREVLVRYPRRPLYIRPFPSMRRRDDKRLPRVWDRAKLLYHNLR